MKVKTGLCDSNGTEICIGDLIQVPVDCNTELHGKWAQYEVKQQGIVPILSYDCSQTGQKLPKGYTGRVLSELYDQEMFLFMLDSKALRPEEEVKIVINEISN